MRQLADVAGMLLPGADFTPERRTSPRNRRRALRWREQLERAAGAAMANAASVEERDRVEAAHREEVAAGPDWPRIRRGSEYNTPPACRDRNALARVLVYLQRLEREQHTKDLAVAHHEGRRVRRSISRIVRPVLVALIGLARRFERCFPSLERLAALALCSRRAVVTALQTLAELGIVVVHRRRKRTVTALGNLRECQDTSAYEIIAPAEIEVPRPRVSPNLHRHQSANVSQQLATQRIRTEKPDLPEVQLPAFTPPEPILAVRAAGTWRDRARESLARAVSQASKR